MATKKQVKEMPSSKRYAILSYIYPKNAGALLFSNYVDPVTKEAVYLEDGNGNRVERTIRPKAVKLDLSVKSDKAFYDFVQKHIYVCGSNPILKLKNINEEAKSENKKIEATMQLNAKIFAMGEDDLLDLGLLLGYDSKLGDNEVVKNKIYKYAATNPQDVLDRINDTDYPLRVLIKKAAQAEDLKQEHGVWKYGQVVIGKDEDQVVLWMKDNPVVRESLKNRFELAEA